MIYFFNKVITPPIKFLSWFFSFWNISVFLKLIDYFLRSVLSDV